MEIEVATSDGIQKVLEHLEAEKTLIANCTVMWKDLANHFSSLEKTLADRSQALDSKIEDLDAQTKQTLEVLDLREASIPERESAAAALIEERKEVAVSELESPDAKAPEDLKGFLQWFCRGMDSAGLWRFVVYRRQELTALRNVISEAVSGSVDPARLVLDAVEDFLSQPSGDGAASTRSSDRSWALGMLLSALFDSDGKKAPEVSESIREKAAVVAEALKSKLDGKEEGEGGGMGGFEAQIFLQMVVAFGLSSKFEEDFLRKLVLEHASRKEMAKLAVGLGFGEKMADIIEELVKTGKQIEAIYFAHESGLTEQFSPAPLIKSYLQSSRKNANTIRRNGNHSIAAIEEASSEELTALRSIIKCVETLSLESKFSLDGMRKRLTQLERAKADRKRTAAANKSQNKRARVSSTAPTYRPSKAVRTSNSTYPSYRRNPPAGHQIPAAARHPYNYPGQVAVHSQSPNAIPQQFYVPEDIGGPRSATPYGGPSIGYGASAQPSYPHQH